MTWYEASQECLAAAGTCLRRGLYRSCVSRAYYAMFCAATRALLVCGVRPRPTLGTWAHEILPETVRRNLGARLPASVAAGLSTRLRHGYKLRLAADYDPSQTMDAETARRCLGYACSVAGTLEDLR